LSGYNWSDHPFGAGVYAVFGSNVVMSIWGGGGEWLRPTLMLAVEEQFYLLLPLLIVATPRRLLPSLLIALWLSATSFRLATCGTHPLAAFSLLPGRMDLLLGGVLAAYANRRFVISSHLTALRVVPLIAMAVLVCALSFSPTSAFLIFSPTLVSMAGACFILAIVHGAPEGRRYRSRLLQYFGQISYALYLVHQPISGILHGVLLNSSPDIGTLPQFAMTLLSALVSVGVAAASWRYLEAPILKRAHTWHAELSARRLAPT
jgi:peptidoglycan/LPS O-acetylase OafA/YrhL